MSYSLGISGALDTSSELYSVHGQLNELYDQLQQRISAFMNANLGIAIDNYTPAQTEMSTGHTRQQEQIGNASTNLQKIVENYDAYDRRSAAGFGGR